MISISRYRSSLLCSAFTLLLASYAYAHVMPGTMNYREEAVQDGWREVFPGGETTCARGDEFSFFYHEGDSDDLVIDFIGGGACWSYQTCKKSTATFIDSVDYVHTRIERTGLNGIYDKHNPKNPLKNWTHVVIPYCTGDLHWGDNVQTYREQNKSVTIFHKGAINARTVIDWALARQQPRRIFITGTSAGGYASLYWLPYVTEKNPNAKILQFSDGAAGVVVEEQFHNALNFWQIEKHAPTWVPRLNPTHYQWENLTMADLYIEIGRHYPSVMLSQFNTFLDSVQSFFYMIMGGNLLTWAEQALASLKIISTSIENFQFFHANGSNHTITPDKDFYVVRSQGVKLVDWVQNMIDEMSPHNVLCHTCGLVYEQP